MKLASAVNYRETLVESINAGGTSEGAKKAWDTRGRGRKDEDKTTGGKLKPQSAEVKLVKKARKDMKTMDNTSLKPAKRLGAAQRSLTDVKKLGDKSNLSSKQKAFFDKQAGVAEKILEKIKNHPKISLTVAAADLYNMFSEVGEVLHHMFDYVVMIAPHIAQAVHVVSHAASMGLLSSAERAPAYVSLQRNMRLAAVLKLENMKAVRA